MTMLAPTQRRLAVRRRLLPQRHAPWRLQLLLDPSRLLWQWLPRLWLQLRPLLLTWVIQPKQRLLQLPSFH